MHKAIVRKSNGKTFCLHFISATSNAYETEFYLTENYPYSTIKILNQKIIRIEWDNSIYH